MPNLNLPIKYIQIIHLGGNEGEICVVNLVTELLNPSRGPNATETIEFSTLVPRQGVTKAIQNLCLIHGHGAAIEIKENMLDQNGFEMPMIFHDEAKLND